MSGTPWLPLSPRQTASLFGALASALPPGTPEPSAGPVGPVAERLLVQLVTALRAERAQTTSAATARARAGRRARRTGFLTGALGAAGAAPREALELVEQARAAVDVAAVVAPGRSDEQLAADLLVVWGLVEDAALAQRITAGTADDPLLALLLRGRVGDAVPADWTVASTLRFLWTARGAVSGLRGGPGVLHAIPVIAAPFSAFQAHRGMQEFETDLRAYYAQTAH